MSRASDLLEEIAELNRLSDEVCRLCDHGKNNLLALEGELDDYADTLIGKLSHEDAECSQDALAMLILANEGFGLNDYPRIVAADSEKIAARSMRLAAAVQRWLEKTLSKSAEDIGLGRYQKPHAAALNDIDGIRISSPNGWWLLRPSNTQDVLVFRAESASEEGLERLKNMALQEVTKLGYTLNFPE